MAYSDQTEFPRGIFHTLVLSDTALDVGTAGQAQRVAGLVAKGGAAAEIIIFRASGGGAELFRLPLAIGERVAWPRFKFYAPGGLEVLTVDTAADVELTIVYYDD